MTHPIIGAWTAEAKFGNQFRTDYLTTTFHADGTATIVTSEGSHDGAWRATDAGSARLLVVRPVPHGEGTRGWFTWRGTAVLSPDGATYTMQTEITRPRPDGSDAPVPATLTASRLTPDTAL